ncbi:MAG: hypothetical protein IPH80_25520 [Myxococcales bacterium]|nr:hypothetical protein [Myxococcales bacterium]
MARASFDRHYASIRLRQRINALTDELDTVLSIAADLVGIPESSRADADRFLTELRRFRGGADVTAAIPMDVDDVEDKSEREAFGRAVDDGHRSADVLAALNRTESTRRTERSRAPTSCDRCDGPPPLMTAASTRRRKLPDLLCERCWRESVKCDECGAGAFDDDGGYGTYLLITTTGGRVCRGCYVDAIVAYPPAT